MSAPDREHQNREYQVSQAFVALADTLVDDYDIIDLLDKLAAHCVSLLAADAAGILLGDARRELRAIAASSEDAQTMELLQLQADQGPCLDCFSTAAPVSVPDITASSDAAARWPQFVEAVARSGAFRSVHALPLRLRGQAIGAMNLFHREPGPLPDADLALGQALADVATIGILSEQAVHRREVLNEQLQAALNNRIVIEQAKGVIAQSLGVRMEEAFDRLRHYCRDHNLRISDAARQIAQGRFRATGQGTPAPSAGVEPGRPNRPSAKPDTRPT